LPVLIARLPVRARRAVAVRKRSAPAYRCGGSRGIRAFRAWPRSRFTRRTAICYRLADTCTV